LRTSGESSGGFSTQELEIRRAGPADLPEVMSLLGASLGWGDDERYQRLFRWKHLDNAFGRSPMWVGTIGSEIVGFRAFMRWRFQLDGGQVEAVRAVDTATHPAHQGKGIFTKLTLQALQELQAEGVGFVFNTPNDQSRPGYLKMGWRLIGRLPVWARPRGPGGLIRMARSRVPAERWSVPTEVGRPAGEALADPQAVEALVAKRPLVAAAAETTRSVDFLRWRYGMEDLHYRALGDPEGGLVFFRLRRRGAAVEAVVCDLLADRAEGRLISRLARETAVDYVIGVGDRLSGSMRVPGGPTLTWRHLCEAEPPKEWRLAMGDIELF
jgi:GNAT superfamily N-acetyltransferase